MVKPKEIAFVPDTSRRGDKMSLGLNDSDKTYIVSSISAVFNVDKDNNLQNASVIPISAQMKPSR